MNMLGWILLCWFCLGLGVLFGWGIRSRLPSHDAPPPAPPPTPPEPDPDPAPAPAPVSTAPPGRRGAETSQLPALGPQGFRVRRPPEPEPDPGPPYPTSPVPAAPRDPYARLRESAADRERAEDEQATTQLRRISDVPGAPPAPPLPGGRRHSDPEAPRMTRREIRELREGGRYGEGPPARG